MCINQYEKTEMELDSKQVEANVVSKGNGLVLCAKCKQPVTLNYKYTQCHNASHYF